MKDFKSPELKRFMVDNPAEFGSLFNSKVYTFDIPIDTESDEHIHTIVSIHPMQASEIIKISLSVGSHQNVRALLEGEVYSVKDILLNPYETLVWQISYARENFRASAYRKFMNVDFDMCNFVLHMNQYNEEMPPFEKAYAKKLQKNKGFTYSRGTIGNWKFIHVYTKNPFPWMDLQAIAIREFGKNSITRVFFNEETQKHPCHFVIWDNPNLTKLF